MQDFVLTDFNIDFRDDEAVRGLQAGTTLHALFAKDKNGLLPTKARAIDAIIDQKAINQGSDEPKTLYQS